MKFALNDLHDYTLAAWSIDQASWAMVFDIHHPENSIQQSFQAVTKWAANGLHGPIGVLELAAWAIDADLLDDRKAFRSWVRVFGYDCSAGEVRSYAQPLIAEHNGQVLATIETVDGGAIDLICGNLTQLQL